MKSSKNEGIEIDTEVILRAPFTIKGKHGIIKQINDDNTYLVDYNGMLLIFERWQFDLLN